VILVAEREDDGAVAGAVAVSVPGPGRCEPFLDLTLILCLVRTETEFGELGSVPKSKSKRRPQPPPRKKRKPSPRWFGVLILGTMFAGVVIIVLNYLGLIPGTGGSADNLYLFVGLGAIAVGFLLATQWY